MAKKRTKKRKSGKRTGKRKMTAKQRKYFGPRRKRAGAKRTRRKGTKRASAKRVTKGFGARLARVEKHVREQKTFNHKTRHMLGVLSHGLTKVFSHTGIAKPKGLRTPSLPRAIGG